MSIPAAYAAVIVIWSTTPLAIKWSAEGLSPISGVFLRMLVATCAGYGLLWLLNKKVRWDKEALKYYAAANIGVLLGLSLVYKASTLMSSGLVSVLFGLSPIMSGIFSRYILGDPQFSSRQKAALAISLFGLAVVFSDKLSFGGDVVVGVLLILVSVSLFSVSGVLIKKQALDIDVLSGTVGTLSMSLPVFALAWVLFDGEMNFSNITLALPSIIYLGVCGSLLGFTSYYYILKNVSATSASLVTLITPVIALCLGSYLNDEIVTLSVGVGAVCICVGLYLFTMEGKPLHSERLDGAEAR